MLDVVFLFFFNHGESKQVRVQATMTRV